MNIVFKSLCRGESIRRTERILDAYAIRVGDAKWNGGLSKEALDAVQKELRQVASETTAAAAFRAEADDTMHLLWTVGQHSAFDQRGRNSATTEHTLFAMQSPLLAITMLAALIHDIGKASKGFQIKLVNWIRFGRHEKSGIRHEMISAWIAHLMLNKRMSWHDAWAQVQKRYMSLDVPIDAMDTPVTLALAMTLTHHRLIGGSISPNGQKTSSSPYVDSENGPRMEDATLAAPDWLPHDNDCARDQMSEIARILGGRSDVKQLEDLAEVLSTIQFDDNQKKAIPALFHLGRTMLQMADHHYSDVGRPSDTIKERAPDMRCAANAGPQGGRQFTARPGQPHVVKTAANKGSRMLNQPLDEHLAGVCSHVQPAFHALECARHDLPSIDSFGIHQRGDMDDRFAWQSRAVDCTTQAVASHPQAGVFGILNAGTGRGKTVASILVAAAAAGDKARLTIASPMRALTRQLHSEYANRTMLLPNELALAAGGLAFKSDNEEEQKTSRVMGSDASFEDDLEVIAPQERYRLPSTIQRYLHKSEKAETFVATPVLCCTIDYINRAAEPHRGSHLIAYMRLVSADVIIDEADQLKLGVLLRTAYVVGLAGRNLFLSTATMLAEAVDAIYRAYREGFASYCAMRGLPMATNALLLSESEQICLPNPQEILVPTQQAWLRRVDYVRQQETLRRGEIIEIEAGATREQAYNALIDQIRPFHERHHVKTLSGRRISAGFIRLDLIRDCAEFAIHLAENRDRAGVKFKMLINHGNFTEIERAYKNHRLATMLKRGGETDALLEDPGIQAMLDEHTDSTLLVISTSTVERGNDFDFDWGLMEPTSVDSIIQMAGRLNRHRQQPKTTPNLGILRFPVNLGSKAFKQDIHGLYPRDALAATHSDFLDQIDARALLGDPELAQMALLEIGKQRLLNDNEFFRKLEGSQRSGHLGVAMSTLYKPELRERQPGAKECVVEVDADGTVRHVEDGHNAGSEYKHYDQDSIFEDLMLEPWKRSEIYEIVAEQGGLSGRQLELGRQTSHSLYPDRGSVITVSDAFGLVNLRE